MKHFLRSFVSVVLLGCIMFVCGAARAQSGDSEREGTATAESNQSNAAPEKKAQEDQTEQFKHSASVRMLGKVTGLGTDGAYWLAVGINFAIVVGVIWWFSRKN